MLLLLAVNFTDYRFSYCSRIWSMMEESGSNSFLFFHSHSLQNTSHPKVVRGECIKDIKTSLRSHFSLEYTKRSLRSNEKREEEEEEEEDSYE